MVYAKSLPANETITAYLTEGAKHDKPIVETGSALSDQEVRRLREGSVRREDDARKQLLKTVMEMYRTFICSSNHSQAFLVFSVFLY